MVAKAFQPTALFLALAHDELRGASETYSGGDVLGSRATTTVLRAAVEQRLDDRPAANEDRAASLRCSDLVTGHREDVERYGLRVDRQLAERLYGVGMKEHAARLGAIREIFDRLDRADLIVHPHDGGDRNVVLGEAVERLQINDAVRCHPTETLLRSLTDGLMDGGEHRLVLDWSRHDRVASLATSRSPRPEQSEIVGLRAARCKTDLIRLRTQTTRHPLPRLLECHPGLSAPTV